MRRWRTAIAGCLVLSMTSAAAFAQEAAPATRGELRESAARLAQADVHGATLQQPSATRRDPLTNGLLIGLAVGLGAAMIGMALGECESGCAEARVSGTILFAGIGAGVGTLVDASRSTMPGATAAPRRARLTVSLRW